MDFLVTKKQFIDQASREYKTFERIKTPFAAVKINVFSPSYQREKVDNIIRNNFRKKVDLFRKNNEGYWILMQDTSIDVAENATKRLKAKLARLSICCDNFSENTEIQAYAYILGSRKEDEQIEERCLNLAEGFSFHKRFDISSFNLTEYLRWIELLDNYETKFRQNKNVNLVV